MKRETWQRRFRWHGVGRYPEKRTLSVRWIDHNRGCRQQEHPMPVSGEGVQCVQRGRAFRWSTTFGSIEVAVVGRGQLIKQKNYGQRHQPSLLLRKSFKAGIRRNTVGGLKAR